MALKTAVKSGVAGTSSTWSPETALATTDELVIPTGIEVKFEASVTVASLTTTGATPVITSKAAVTVTLGGSGNSLNLSGPTTVTNYLGKIVLSPGSGTTTEPILNGIALGTLSFFGTATSKFKLKEALTTTVEFIIKGGIFKSENFELNLSKFVWEGATGKEIVLGTSLVKMSAANPFTGGVTQPTLSIASSTWEFTANELTLEYNAGGAEVVTLPTVKLVGKKALIKVQMTNLELAMTGERTVEIPGGFTASISGTISKTAAIHILKRNGAGEAHLKKASGNVALEGMEVENIIAEGGVTFAITNGKDLGGNTGFIFIFTGGFSHSVGTPVSIKAQKIASSPLTQSLSSSTSLSARKVASSVLSQGVGMRGTASALKRALGALSGQSSMTTVFQGLHSAGGQLASKLGFIGSAKANKVGIGASTTSLGMRSSASGQKVGLSALTLPLPLRAIIAGSKATRGTLLNTPAVGQQFVGGKAGTGGALANAVAFGGVVVGMKVTEGALQARVTLDAGISAVARRLGALLGALGLEVFLRGEQIEGEVLRLTVQLDAMPTVAVGLEADATMTVDLAAAPANP